MLQWESNTCLLLPTDTHFWFSSCSQTHGMYVSGDRGGIMSSVPHNVSVLRRVRVKPANISSLDCLSLPRTCCEPLTNHHGTLPNRPVTDAGDGWRLIKMDWKTSTGPSSGELPWFIMPVFMPEATGSTLSARTDPSQFEAYALSWHISDPVEVILPFN